VPLVQEALIGPAELQHLKQVHPKLRELILKFLATSKYAAQDLMAHSMFQATGLTQMELRQLPGAAI
jgi:hypothetical protein